MSDVIYTYKSSAVKKEYIDIDGVVMNIAHIPAIISIPVMEIYDEIAAITMRTTKGLDLTNPGIKEEVEKKLTADTETAKKLLGLQVDLLTLYFSYYDARFDKTWISDNLTTTIIGSLVGKIITNIIGEISSDLLETAEGGGKKKSNGKRYSAGSRRRTTTAE